MKNPNLLILDEPTNDLDIVTLNILEEYLKEYGGSLIVVSHDRHFLDRVVDHLLVFCGEGQVKDFIGSFSEYRAYVRDLEASKKKDRPAAENPQPRPKAEKKKLSYKESRELASIEERLPALEEERAALEQSMSSGTLEYGALQEASERFEALSAEIDGLETRWLELQG